jgi:hypothetical protein
LRESSPLCDGNGYRGRGSGTTATTVTDAANVDDDKATATTVTDAASVDDDEVTSGGRRCPTTAMTNVNDDEATSGGRRRPTANVNDDEAGVDKAAADAVRCPRPQPSPTRQTSTYRR